MDMNVAVSIAFSISGRRSLKFAEVMSIFLTHENYLERTARGLAGLLFSFRS